MTGARTLEQVLADWRGEAAVLRRRGHDAQAATIEQLADDVAGAAEDYLTFAEEREAQLYSGRKRPWLRARFRDWERDGNAYRQGGHRYYRLIVLPRRADLASARTAGRRAAEDVAA